MYLIRDAIYPLAPSTVPVFPRASIRNSTFVKIRPRELKNAEEEQYVIRLGCHTLDKFSIKSSLGDKFVSS